MNTIYRGIILLCGLILVWQLVVYFFQLPSYILPTPIAVFKTIYFNKKLILSETFPTIIETLSGLFLGVLLGSFIALIMVFIRPLALWILPLLLISQAIPVFAIAPLLVIWFGYGITSKIITTVIMLFFPVASAFFDGLKQTEKGWLDLATTMNASKWKIFWCIKIPAALPSLASGLRVATAIAPIGAIVGEWVGASHGLGFLMLNANARMQIDLMFAALGMLIIFSLGLYFFINKLLSIAIPWQKETST